MTGPLLTLIALTVIAAGLIVALLLKIRAQGRAGQMRVVNREDGDVYFLESTAVGRVDRTYPDFWDIRDSELGELPPVAGSYQGTSGATLEDYDPLGR